MPSTSERQRRWAGAELGRIKRGEATDSGMTRKQLRDFAHKPEHKCKGRGKCKHKLPKKDSHGYY